MQMSHASAKKKSKPSCTVLVLLGFAIISTYFIMNTVMTIKHPHRSSQRHDLDARDDIGMSLRQKAIDNNILALKDSLFNYAAGTDAIPIEFHINSTSQMIASLETA